MEDGSAKVNDFYETAWSQSNILFFSSWNVGEVIDALGRKVRKMQISVAEKNEMLGYFFGETGHLAKGGSLITIPMTSQLLQDTWELALKESIRVPDALQIASARERICDLFLTADENLGSHARKHIKVEMT